MSPPERILFFVDVSAEMGREQLKPSGMTRINVTKNLLKRFIWLKSSFSRNHEYGIVELGSCANWHTPFTNDICSIISALDSLQCHEDDFESMEADSILETILQAQPDIPNPPTAPSLRAIIIYGRSDVVPSQPDPEQLANLRANPCIFIDAIYLHGSVRTYGPVIQQIFDRISEFELREDMYMFELSQRSATYGISMARLLAHPLQRVKKQADAFPVLSN
ncbi:hypothetical protein SeMB42_g01480 [Synchytrium endobioticum]|uniref:BRISC and BRCA1-A complex member 1 n=1 Tax=Synchytrium endobioticum TaxID=286115 RepID=A0A507DEB6_9FUNG|nr:hypothetical protein SeLEV6574_g01193 [Synchytrium endobioticum]TPX52350.1 hypothetical protein SeMB42_g01480 [Synchytrium endobioticum]